MSGTVGSATTDSNYPIAKISHKFVKCSKCRYEEENSHLKVIKEWFEWPLDDFMFRHLN